MRVLYAVSEAYPFAKQGGLGEVAGAYPAALREAGAEVRGIMPLYDTIPQDLRDQMEFLISFPVQIGLETVFCGLYQTVYEGSVWYFIENSRCFQRGALYGFRDDDLRFAFFSKAVCESVRYLGWEPEILHCNDWQTALVPVYLEDYRLSHPEMRKIHTMFTIHNVEFQGDFSYETLTDVFGLSGILFAEGTMELEGGVNLMKGAIETSDCVTTVSPSYAREITAPDAVGPLAEVIASHRVTGILNGIPGSMNPGSPLVQVPYSLETLDDKVKNKRWMQEHHDLEVRDDVPVCGFVGRLLERKGIHLLLEVIPEFLERGCQLVLTGDGDPKIMEVLRDLGERFPRQVAVLPYSEAYAVEIYSSADFLLMPSREEPCGTAQMEAMMFGTVPLVRATGGLQDSVVPFDPEHPQGWGFTFGPYTSQALRDAISCALAAYDSPETFRMLQVRCMTRDFSWKKSAEAYAALYQQMLNQ